MQAVNNKSVASARTRPQGMEDHQGRASQHKVVLGDSDSEEGGKDRDKGREYGYARAKELGIHLSPDACHLMDEGGRAEREGARDAMKDGSARGESPTPGIRGRAAHNHGLDREGDLEGGEKRSTGQRRRSETR